MLNCPDRISEDSLVYLPKTTRTAKRIDIGDKNFLTTVDNNNLPKAVIFRDSFGAAIQPFISEHFSRITWIWKHKIDLKLIEEEQPDFVIVELVERYLGSLLYL